MNPFMLAPQARLAAWREFRHAIGAYDEAAQLQAVADFWSQAPLSPTLFAIDDPWPTTWEMLQSNNFCRHSLALGMESTLRLLGWSSQRLILKMINDFTVSLLVLVVDERLMLNYAWGKVVPVVAHPVLRQWRFATRDYRVIVADP
jgi:hypothetical protein